jgi:hypothetical protein
MILVHSINVWQKSLDPTAVEAARSQAIPWPKWAPKDVPQEDWGRTQEMLAELSAKEINR